MRKKFINLLVVFTMLMSIVATLGLNVSAAPVVTALSATKDSWIVPTGSLASTDVDNPNPYNLKVQNLTNSDLKRITFIEFNLSSITGTITNATLQLKCTAITSSPQTVKAYETVPLDYTWPNEPTDNGMTGANAPTVGAEIPGSSVSVTTSGSTYTLDVTPFIQSRYISGAKKVMIAILNNVTVDTQYVLFNSIEGGTAPKLNVTSIPLPTVCLTAPYNNSYYMAGDTVTVKATVGNKAVGVTTSNVIFKLDDVTVSGTPTVSGASYSLDIPNITIGTHTIKCEATNSDGAVATTAPITINVTDNTTIYYKANPIPIAGAFVERGSSVNYGGSSVYAYNLKKDGTSAYDYLVFLKFDLSTVKDTLVNATVKLNCSGVQTAGQAAVPVQAYKYSDNTWTSTSITGSNMNALGEPILGAVSTINIGGDVGYFDITSYANEQIAAGNKIFSVAFFTTTTTNNYVAFSSRIAYGNEPRILLTTTKQYDVVSSNYTDALLGNGNVVTTLTSGAELRHNITINNNTTSPMPVLAIIALYDSSHKIVQINVNNIDTSINGDTQKTTSVGFTLPNYSLAGYYVKSFLWNGVGDIVPLVAPAKIPAS